MTLPSDYSGQACSLARALEVVGERWSLLILRDAFYGVRRFNDFAAHLRIPRAVLTARLKSLVTSGVLERGGGQGRRAAYALTPKGLTLWTAVRALTSWGDENYSSNGPLRIFVHDADTAPVDEAGRCGACGESVPVGHTLVTPGPGLPPPGAEDDPVTVALREPHRLLEALPG